MSLWLVRCAECVGSAVFPIPSKDTLADAFLPCYCGLVKTWHNPKVFKEKHIEGQPFAY